MIDHLKKIDQYRYEPVGFLFLLSVISILFIGFSNLIWLSKITDNLGVMYGLTIIMVFTTIPYFAKVMQNFYHKLAKLNMKLFEWYIHKQWRNQKTEPSFNSLVKLNEKILRFHRWTLKLSPASYYGLLVLCVFLLIV